MKVYSYLIFASVILVTDPASQNVNTGRFAFDNLFNFILGILIVKMIAGKRDNISNNL